MAPEFSFNYFGSTIIGSSLGTSFVPPLSETLTAHCVPITDDGKVVAVNIIGRGIDVPGGHIDPGETALEAMEREAMEEAWISVGQPVLIDVWKLKSQDVRLGLDEKPYLLLYAARVETMLDFTPTDETSERLILEPDEYVSRYFGDKNQAKKMITQALRYFSEAGSLELPKQIHQELL
jgi:8-oxo-dGTP pyrophosphatase MutT (NUDIX family)